MTDFTDPAAEIAMLKALEKGKTAAWPTTMPPDAKKLKKALPTTTAAKKPRHVPTPWIEPHVTYRPFTPGGIPLAQVVQALLALAAAIAAALLID